MATLHSDIIAGTLTSADLDGIFGAGNWMWWAETTSESHLWTGWIETIGISTKSGGEAAGLLPVEITGVGAKQLLDQGRVAIELYSAVSGDVIIRDILKQSVIPPAVAFPPGTKSVVLSLTTDVNATCQYTTSALAAYGSPTMRQFSSTGFTSHRTTLTGLGGLTTNTYPYTYYVKCRNMATGEENPFDSDYLINFTIGGATLISGPSNYLCIVNDAFIRNNIPYFQAFPVWSPASQCVKKIRD